MHGDRCMLGDPDSTRADETAASGDGCHACPRRRFEPRPIQETEVAAVTGSVKRRGSEWRDAAPVERRRGFRAGAAMRPMMSAAVSGAPTCGGALEGALPRQPGPSRGAEAETRSPRCAAPPAGDHARRRFARAARAVLVAALLAAAGCGPAGEEPLTGALHVEVNTNAAPAFSVGLVPTMAPPVPVGALLGFRLSSRRAGHGHLYLISATGDVLALAENLPLAAGAQVDYPPPAGGVQILAQPPAGVERLVLLATSQPFVGFAGNSGQTVTLPVALASTAEVFLRELNRTTRSLPASSWAAVETRVEVVE